MKDEELLAAMRAAEIEEEAAYQKWEATPEGRAHLDVRPGALDALTATALAGLAPARPGATRSPSIKRSTSNAGLWAAAGAIAIAAGVALWVTRATVTPLPAYEVAIVEGGEQTSRADAPAPSALVYRPGATFALTVRPATQVSQAVGVRGFVASGTSGEAIELAVRANERGVAQVRGTWPARAFERPPDALVIIVGPTSDLPVRAPSADDRDAHAWRTVRVPVRAAER